MQTRKTLAVIVSIIIMATFLQGCNTMRGAGQDIEEAGEAIEDAAD